MELLVDVPLSTAIADLDEVLRLLLKRELSRHGFDGVDIAFETPSKEWSAKLSSPTVDLFLYDLREAGDRAEQTPREQRENGTATVTPPPLQLELSYTVSAWTRAVEDEHRLLSQVLAILNTYRRLPADLLQGRANGASALQVADTSVGRPREEKADFWTSVGGQYKASIDFVVHITIESGTSSVRGPQVRVPTVRTRLTQEGAGGVTELHQVGGTVKDSDGTPLAHVWVVVPESGRWTATDEEGRFILRRLGAGAHGVLARTSEGDEVKARVSVPRDRLDLVVPGARSAPPARKR
jgi:hypothetical protein